MHASPPACLNFPSCVYVYTHVPGSTTGSRPVFRSLNLRGGSTPPPDGNTSVPDTPATPSPGVCDVGAVSGGKVRGQCVGAVCGRVDWRERDFGRRCVLCCVVCVCVKQQKFTKETKQGRHTKIYSERCERWGSDLQHRLKKTISEPQIFLIKKNTYTYTQIRTVEIGAAASHQTTSKKSKSKYVHTNTHRFERRRTGRRRPSLLSIQ